jgi:hypothetical protein
MSAMGWRPDIRTRFLSELNDYFGNAGIVGAQFLNYPTRATRWGEWRESSFLEIAVG